MSNLIDALMRGGLLHIWQAPLSPSLPQFLFCLHLHHFFLSRLFSVLPASFIWDSLSVFRSVSALVPLCLTSPCCHQSLAPCLSVTLCLIAIDRFRSHKSTNLIKSDKCRYFYRCIREHAHSCKMQGTYTPIHTHTPPLRYILNLYLFLIDRLLTFGWKILVLIVPLFNFDTL